MKDKESVKQNWIERSFILIVIVVSLVALWKPIGFIWMKPHIPLLLGVVMFGMGVTLEFLDFIKIWKQGHLVLIGILLQYFFMPLLAVFISFAFQLPEEVMIGMVLVGACPGGTASNVMAYLSRANLALSVTLTLLSTLLAPLLTPVIVYLLLSHSIEVSFLGMMKSVFWIVFIPLIGGLVFRHFLYQRFQHLIALLPSLSIVFITAIIGCVIALNQSLLLSFPLMIILAVILHNTMGMTVGYWGARIFKASKRDARTLAFEVGMQNSGLGVTLASQFFTSLSALPGAIFSVVHNLSGLTIANWWGRSDSSEK
jgi:BASS family bile acid:Na+ symporter